MPHGEGLRDEVYCTAADGLHGGLDVVAPRHDDHHGAVGTRLPDQLQARAIRKVHVHQDDVVARRGQALARFRHGARYVAIEAPYLQHGPHDRLHAFLVLEDEDPRLS